jgi:predicted ATPase
MKLLGLTASRYRSLRDQHIPLHDLNLFIGTNASGKSTILDALRFLNEGIQERDFRTPVFSRGGILHLAWKGEDADRIELKVVVQDNDRSYEWSVVLTRDRYEFDVRENLHELRPGSPPMQLLFADKGRGWWWSGQKGNQVTLAQSSTSCALAAAAADASFPARAVSEFVSGWGFFDPNPFLLRRDWNGMDSTRFDSYGRNLGERLYVLSEQSPSTFKAIVEATQTVLGLPTNLQTRQSEDRDRFYFVQDEPGLRFPVHQMGVSSGTLRTLALMAALFGESGTHLIGIEEPENHIHPTALAAFADYLLKARNRVQILVTTHSPLLLTLLNDPASVCVVRHSDLEGTRVIREQNPESVRLALKNSGFGLGEFYETKGFGA